MAISVMVNFLLWLMRRYSFTHTYMTYTYRLFGQNKIVEPKRGNFYLENEKRYNRSENFMTRAQILAMSLNTWQAMRDSVRSVKNSPVWLCRQICLMNWSTESSVKFSRQKIEDFQPASGNLGWHIFYVLKTIVYVSAPRPTATFAKSEFGLG